jgi:hypothetical protein
MAPSFVEIDGQHPELLRACALLSPFSGDRDDGGANGSVSY